MNRSLKPPLRKLLTLALLFVGAEGMFAATPRRPLLTRTPAAQPATPTPAPPIGTVQGRIVGKTSGKPLAGAKIFLCAYAGAGECSLDRDRVATANAEGAFQIEAPPELYYVLYDPSGETEAYKARGRVNVHFAPMLQEHFGAISGTVSVPADRGMPADGKSGFSRSWGLFKILGGSRFTLASPGGVGVVEKGDGAISTYGGLPGVLEIRNGRPVAATVEKGKTTEVAIDAWGR
ncbi:MAG: hypothetical protein ABI610_10145 [Acidobacteriota bacterium]